MMSSCIFIELNYLHSSKSAQTTGHFLLFIPQYKTYVSGLTLFALIFTYANEVVGTTTLAYRRQSPAFESFERFIQYIYIFTLLFVDVYVYTHKRVYL